MIGKTVSPKRLGKGDNYVEVGDNGFLTLHGEARTGKIITYACENWYPAHHDPLGIEALANPGYISSTLTTAPGANRKLRIYSVGDGIHLKGEQAGGWTTGDTST